MLIQNFRTTAKYATASVVSFIIVQPAQLQSERAISWTLLKIAYCASHHRRTQAIPASHKFRYVLARSYAARLTSPRWPNLTCVPKLQRTFWYFMMAAHILPLAVKITRLTRRATSNELASTSKNTTANARLKIFARHHSRRWAEHLLTNRSVCISNTPYPRYRPIMLKSFEI